jgi:acylglycerol lipase
VTSTTTIVTGPGGQKLLTRHWAAVDPWAALLIVHGLGEHSGRYEHVGARFSGAGIDTHALDLRGFGASEGHRAYCDSWQDYLGDVEQSLATARATGVPTVLYGHSMGGLVSLSYALSGRPAPGLLVLSAPAVDADISAPKRIAAKVLGRIAPKVALPNDIEGHQLSRDPAVGEAYFSDPLVYTRTTARLGFEMLTAMDEVRATLEHLSVPTLVIHGGADTVVPTDVTASLEALAGVDRLVREDLRHEMHNEPEQDEILDHVVGWIRGRIDAG